MRVQREELAWAGGLFEGEGCITLTSFPSRYKSLSPQLVLTMQEEDSVRRFAAAVGLGKIRARPPRGNEKRPSSRWRTGGFPCSQAVIAMLWPWLGHRRQETAKQILVEGRGKNRSQASFDREARKRIL